MAAIWTTAPVALAATILAVLELFFLPQSSPTLVTLSDTHGVHASDLVAVALWTVVMVVCWRVVLRHRARPAPDPAD